MCGFTCRNIACMAYSTGGKYIWWPAFIFYHISFAIRATHGGSNHGTAHHDTHSTHFSYRTGHSPQNRHKNMGNVLHTICFQHSSRHYIISPIPKYRSATIAYAHNQCLHIHHPYMGDMGTTRIEKLRTYYMYDIPIGKFYTFAGSNRSH